MEARSHVSQEISWRTIVGSVTVPRNQSLSRFSRMTKRVFLVVKVFHQTEECFPVRVDEITLDTSLLDLKTQNTVTVH
jgi:hypothetical protein